jgi:hypothetical protein
MNMRERMLAVIRGEEHDRVPFVQYDGCGGPTLEVWKKIGADNMGILRWCSAHRFEHPNCRFEREEIAIDGKPGVRNTLITPKGSLTEERPFVPSMGGVAGYKKHYVERVEDYQILLAYFRDIRVVKDTSTIEKNTSEIGEHGLPHVSVPRSPFQQLWVEWVSILDLGFHLMDIPGIVEECMEIAGRVFMRAADIALEAAGEIEIPYIVIPDNITAPVIGEKLFRRYCVPCYRRTADLMAENNIPVFVHMDGDLKPLWNAIGESGILGIDSLSPPPDNDTSVADALSMWPHMRLLLNFPSSVHVAEPDVIYRTACEILEQGEHSGRLQIQISENIPARAWEKSFPEIVRAIAGFRKR